MAFRSDIADGETENLAMVKRNKLCRWIKQALSKGAKRCLMDRLISVEIPIFFTLSDLTQLGFGMQR